MKNKIVKDDLDDNLGKIVRVGNPIGDGWVEGELGKGKCGNIYHVDIGRFVTITFFVEDVIYYQRDAQSVLEIGLRL